MNEEKTIEAEAEVVTDNCQGLVERETHDIQMAPASQSDSMMAMVMDVAADQSIDLDRVDHLLEMAKQLKKEEQEIKYNAAMSKCQGEMPNINTRWKNDHTGGNYAKAGDILKAIKPIYSKHGFSIALFPMEDPKDGWIKVGCDVSHEDGFTKHYDDISPIDDRGSNGTVNKTVLQARESAKTYLKKSLIGLAFALEIGDAGSDKDGNGGDEEKVDDTPITDEQALEIESTITDNDLDMGVFKTWMESHLNVKSISGIPARQFVGCMQLLRRSINRKADMQKQS